jgi:hypothetical protein
VPPGSSVIASVRKEVRGVGVCAPAHIIDRVVRDAGISKLKSDQCSEIALGFVAIALHDCAAVRCTLELAGNVFADLECADANVGADRNDELPHIVRKHFERSGHDPCHRTAPTSVHGTDVSARGMRDQDRHAIGRTRSDPETFDARDQCIAFQISDRLAGV